MTSVFISHAARDPWDRAIAEGIANTMVAFGVEVSLPPVRARCGYFRDAATIRAEMDVCNHFIYVASPAGLQCECVGREIAYALERHERDPVFKLTRICNGEHFEHATMRTDAIDEVRSAKSKSTTQSRAAYNASMVRIRRMRRNPPRRARERPINVTYLTPCLLIGGTEHWFLANAKYANPYRIAWHVGLTDAVAQDPSMVESIKRYAAVTCGRAAIRKLVRKMDVVVIWGIYYPRELIADFHGPVVIVAHGCGVSFERWTRSAKSCATHLAAVSPLAAETFRKSSVHVIPNGADPARCFPTEPRGALRGEWNVSPQEIAVGYVGRISAEKNCIAVARAVRELGRPFRAVFVGPTYDAAYASRVQAECPSAVFAPPSEPVGNALAALDVVVTVSPREGGPLIALEAMIAGVPIVATPVGILPQLISEFGELFVAVPVEPTATQVAQAIKKAISPEWRHVALRASAIVSENYHAARMSNAWTDFLISTIDQWTGTGDARHSRSSRLRRRPD